MAELKNTTIDDTGFLRVPTNTTNNRPVNPDEGDLFFDTTEKSLLAYINGQWNRLELL